MTGCLAVIYAAPQSNDLENGLERLGLNVIQQLFTGSPRQDYNSLGSRNRFSGIGRQSNNADPIGSLVNDVFRSLLGQNRRPEARTEDVRSISQFLRSQAPKTADETAISIDQRNEFSNRIADIDQRSRSRSPAFNVGSLLSSFLRA